MTGDDPNPCEVTLALKIAYLRGSWEAVSEIIHSLEDAYGEVSLVDLARIQHKIELDSMEATDAENEPPIILVDWGPTAEA